MSTQQSTEIKESPNQQEESIMDYHISQMMNPKGDPQTLAKLLQQLLQNPAKVDPPTSSNLAQTNSCAKDSNNSSNSQQKVPTMKQP